MRAESTPRGPGKRARPVSRWSPHVTVAAVAQRRGRYLVVEERIDGEAVINQPAGHLEAGESLLDAVRRETLEETAWQFTPMALLGVYRWVHPGRGTTFLRFAFAGEVQGHNRSRPLDPEVLAVHWLSRTELMQRRHALRSPQVLACVDDYEAGTRYPLSVLNEVLSS
jgi:8-oxo-dGTP pyrophosphatase MutT (NUDIX family)